MYTENRDTIDSNRGCAGFIRAGSIAMSRQREGYDTRFSHRRHVSGREGIAAQQYTSAIMLPGKTIVIHDTGTGYTIACALTDKAIRTGICLRGFQHGDRDGSGDDCFCTIVNIHRVGSRNGRI